MKKYFIFILFIAGISTSYAQTVTPAAPDFGYADAGVIAVNHFLEINNDTAGITLATFSYFGRSIANLGDLDGSGAGVTTIAVGATGNNGTGGFARGAVYIINLNADGTILGTPVEINSDHTKITLADNDNFGTSIANLGDLDGAGVGVTTIAVGITGDDTGGIARGALYLINLRSTGVIEGTPVKITTNTTGITLPNRGVFGFSIANLGDLDVGLSSATDKTNSLVTIAVGAGGDDTGVVDAGAIYIINLDSAGAIVGTAVKIDNDHSKITLLRLDRFGFSIADLGDLDGSGAGVTTIAVGAEGDDTGGSQRGALYLINLRSTGVIEGTPVKITTNTTGITLANDDGFGASVIDLGDLDGGGAGVTTIAVGTTLGEKTYIINLNASGAIIGTVGVINNAALSTTIENNDEFGSSMANLGDINGDGIDEIVIGEKNEDTGEQDSGEIHIISFAKKQYSFTTSDNVDLTLPAVEVGSPAPTYTLSPTTLPAGLSFDGTARTITGTPTAISAATEYTLTATIGSDTDTFVFSIDTSSAAVAANNAPTAITLDNLSVPENTTAVGNLSTTDLDGSDTHTYFLAAGTGDEDNGKFTIDNTADTIAFTTAPDFENPTDVGDTANNNTYAIRVETDDSNGGTFAQTFIITVADVTEAATFTIDAIAAASVSEGATYTSVTPSLSGDSPIGTVTYAKSGTDSDDFTIDTSTGVVSMVARNYETPEDADTSNDYEITITATDSDGNTASQNWTVSVTDYLELGGVSINPALWVKANEGITETSNVITGWTDQSPSPIAGTSAGDPVLSSSFINFNPSVLFDGSNDYFEFNNPSSIKERDDFTFVAVAGSNDISNTSHQHLLGTDNQNGVRITFRKGNLALHRSGSGDLILDPDPPVASGDIGIVAVSRSGSNGNDIASYQDGAKHTTTSGHSFAAATTKTFLGRRARSGELLNGQIAELVVFENVLSETDLNKIQTNLAIKYGITLHSYVPDYVNSAGTSVFANSGTYVNDIVGIAKDDTSILDQRISKSKNTGVILTISTDATFTGVNSGHTDSLTDGQYLIIGNDGGATTTQTTETPGSTTNRITREWKVENTGSVGEVNLKFDGLDDTYTLYTDADGDFSAGATEGRALNSDGEIAATLTDGIYFTLSTTTAPNTAPTDITLTLTNTTVDENQTVVGTFSTTDANVGDTHTYSLVSGTGDEDNDKFTLDSATGVIAFTTAPDFENPTDAGSTANNNTYTVRVQTSDGIATYRQNFVITVTNVVEAATFNIGAIADATVSEGTAYTSSTPSISGDTPIGSVTYTKSGNDADDFTINSSTGVVSMVPRDYENPEDADTSNDYEITITATDDDGNTATQNWTVSVTNYLELGGVSTSPALWVKANEGITENASNVITGWTDQSPSAVAGTPAGSPVLSSSFINFNPAVLFDGTNDYFEFNRPSPISGRKSFTFIAVAGQNDISSDRFQFVLGANRGDRIGILFRNGNIARHRQIAGVVVVEHLLDPDPPVASGDIGIVGIRKVNGDTADDFTSYQDGAEFTKSAVNSSYTPVNTTSTFIGRESSSYRLNGQIAELVVFEDALSEADLDKVQTHLAIKYGITLDDDVANYVNSGGTSVFANSGTYVNDIVGIAKDDTSILDQRISKSKNDGVILTISTDPTFTGVNSGHTGSLTDGQYLIIGNDGGATTTQTTETPGVTTSRITREWKVENTGSVGEVNLKFDGFDNAYTLYTDDDGDFSTGATLAGALNANGEIAATFSNGVSYFTLTTAPTNSTPTDITLTLTNAAVNENQTAVGAFSTTDADVSDSHTYTLATGTGDEDNDKFTLDSATGVIAFTTAPDHENPTDAGDTAGDNTYAVRVQTDDGNGGTFEKEFIITVTDVDETDAFLSNLVVGGATISPAFEQTTEEYTVLVDAATTSISITPTVSHPDATIMIGLASAASGSTTPILLLPGLSVIDIFVTAEDGTTQKVYMIRITKGQTATISINTISGNGFVNAVDDNSDITISGESANIAEGETINVRFPGISTITDLSALVLANGTWSTAIPTAEMTATTEGTIEVTASYTGATDGNESFTYDRTAPTLAAAITDRTATVGTDFSFRIPTGTFTDANTLTYTSSGEGNGISFSSRTWSGVGANLTAGTLTITVTAEDVAGNTATDEFDIVISGNNDPTDIALTSTTVPENTTAVGTFSTTDADVSDSHTYTLATGTGDEDNDKFTLDSATGVIAFTTAPDHENPTDAGDTAGDNTYAIRVQTDDGNGGTFEKEFIITVTDVNEAVLGGVSTSPALWVKANEGITENSSNVITGWTDQSPSAVAGSPAGNPVLSSSFINFNPTVLFDGTNDRFEFNRPSPITGRNNFTFIAVAGQNDPSTALFQHVLGTNRANGVGILFRSGNITLDRSSTGHIIRNPDPPVALGDIGIVGISRSGSNGNNFASYQDGAEHTTSSARADYTFEANTTSTFIGSGLRGNGKLNGQVAELVVFEDVLSEADLDKVQTHLAIKYGITLHSNVANYVNAAGTSVFANSGTYVSDIVGIAKDDTSVLDQRISKSKNGGVILTISTDATFTGVNSGHTGSLTDGQYLIIGNDGGATTTQTTETPGVTTSRITREWKVENTGSVGEVNLKFDGFDNTYTLYTDDDGDFSTGATLAGALNANGEIAATFSNGVSYFTLTTAPLTTWTGTTDSTWTTATNWTDGVPTATHNVLIPKTTNQPTAATAVTVNKVTINSGASLIANAAFNGNVIYNREINFVSGSLAGWYLMASPVAGETYDDTYVAANDIGQGSLNNRGIATYNTSTNSWEYFQSGGSGTFVSGKGYSIKKQTSTGAVAFTGTLNTDDVDVVLETTATNRFNLLGNPYPSYLNSTTFLNSETAISEEKTLWVWNQGISMYEAKNLVESLMIAPGQGFFVKANTGGGTFNFSKANQSHTTTDTFQKSEKTQVKLDITDGDNHKNYCKIYYSEETTSGFDVGYDGELFSGAPNPFAIYTHLVSDSEGENYQIQSLPYSDIENMVIPVGVNAASGKEISISADVTNFPAGVHLYLEDKLENSFTKLSKNGAKYTVTLSDDLEGIGRFFLRASSSDLDDFSTSLENISVYTSSKNNLRIVGIQDGNVKLKAYNILGVEIIDTSFKGNGKNDVAIPSLAAGIYIVHLEMETGKISKKLVVE